MNKIALTFIVFLTLSLSSLSQAGEFVIGVEDIEYYPIYAKRDGEYAGFAREVLDEFAKAEKHIITYKIVPIKRLYRDFLDGKLDFKFPDSSYWKSDMKEGKGVVYSDPVLDYIDGVLVPKDGLGQGKEKLKNLGVLRGFTAWDYLDAAKSKEVRIKEGNTLKGLIKMAESKRIDGVYFNVIVARYYLESTQFDKDLLLFDDDLPHTRGSYYLSTIKHPEVIESFNLFMKNNKGLIEQLKAKYNVKLY